MDEMHRTKAVTLSWSLSGLLSNRSETGGLCSLAQKERVYGTSHDIRSLS